MLCLFGKEDILNLHVLETHSEKCILDFTSADQHPTPKRLMVLTEIFPKNAKVLIFRWQDLKTFNTMLWFHDMTIIYEDRVEREDGLSDSRMLPLT